MKQLQGLKRLCEELGCEIRFVQSHYKVYYRGVVINKQKNRKGNMDSKMWRIYEQDIRKNVLRVESGEL